MGNIANPILSGCISGSLSTLMLQPFDVLKTRLQDPGKHEPRSLFKVFTGLVKKEGISSLWRGTTPTLLRSVPGIAIYFTSLEIIEGSFNPDRSSKILSFLASAFSRTTAGLAVMPFTVMKTRLESGKFTYSSILGGLGQIYRHEGLRGFTYGLLPTLLRDIPYSGIYYVLYNAFKSLAFGIYMFYVRVFLAGSIVFSFLKFLMTDYNVLALFSVLT